ncbi:hypothetical protein [Streptomyces sp. NPDC048516]|uniref:hypothetical protein n=1 Tax=Streptomyces sp. NPDC048516 TaxID=3365565 RepID=UPI003720670C
MRTLTSAGALVAAGGLALGLMAAPAFATPAASASTASASPATVRLAGGGWHIKNAKNVADSGVPKPGRSVVCNWVMSGGGKKTHGEVCFDPDGDTFYVKDSLADGMSISMRALYRGNTQTVFECRDYLGGAKGWTACDFSREMREGRGINFIAMAWKGNTPKYKSSTADAEN